MKVSKAQQGERQVQIWLDRNTKFFLELLLLLQLRLLHIEISNI